MNLCLALFILKNKKCSKTAFLQCYFSKRVYMALNTWHLFASSLRVFFWQAQNGFLQLFRHAVFADLNRGIVKCLNRLPF